MFNSRSFDVFSVIQENTCLIDGNCYSFGELKYPYDQPLRCEPERNGNNFTEGTYIISIH